MAHKKGQGSSRNGRDSESKRLGVKVFGGQEIKAGANIDITISLGKYEEETIVPDLIGKSLYEARQRLKLLELKIGEIIYEERSNILPETVVKQSIPGGEYFDPGDTIILTVSKEETES